ncbi:MAG: hypothetical protein FJ368_03200 [Pelagibacterales bacterium]|nr:hypothetical protein [Pelagibacterales bacterium]
MGTRHLIEVKFNNEIKVAQYGQCDGYPTGQGIGIANFISDKNNIAKLKENLTKCRFWDKEKDKDFLEDYDSRSPTWSSDPDNRTEEQKEWYNNFISRDLGSDILENIAKSEKEEILLKDSSEFKKDGLFCEYHYLIDLDKEVVFLNNKEITFADFTKEAMENFED